MQIRFYPAFFSIPINFLLAAFIGYTGVNAALHLWRPLPPLPRVSVGHDNRDDPAMVAAQTIEVQPIVERHLFGRPPAPQPKARIEPVAAPPEVPETALNFKLRGILYSSDSGGDTRAVIQMENGNTEVFQPGAEIVPGVTLHRLYADKALLLRAGRYETLTLEGSDSPGKDKLARHEAGPVTSPTASSAKLAEYRRELLQNPQRMSRYVRLRPVQRQGKLFGYRLLPGRQRGLLEEFGLQGGDVVTAVNGTKLDSAVQGLSVLQELAEARQIQLEIERGGTPLSLGFAVPDE